MRAYNFFSCGPKFTKCLTHNMGGVVVDPVFLDFVISIYSGVIRAQTRKLSEIAPNFGYFWRPNFCWGHPFQNLYRIYHALLAPRRPAKFREVTLTNPKVIVRHIRNFKRNF